jgi:phosphodiesterase/alkaline phosphatase D-like protein
MVCYALCQGKRPNQNAEFANNGYRDGFSGLNNTEDSFLNVGKKVTVDTRKVNAVRAYFEWMPIRYAIYPLPLYD